MSTSILMAAVMLGVIVITMIAEGWISQRHERALRARGAAEPRDDVYTLMQVAYPFSFLAMTVEGGVFGVADLTWLGVGALVFLAAKGLKYWAIASLGVRWTFRVLVPTDAPLVRHGPYRWLSHPNYIGVIGELLGTALMMAATITGVLSIVGFGLLITQRVAVENRALGRVQ